MCGLVGTFGHVPPAAARQQALAALAHRGPDGSAEWRTANAWLGHTLLAITDTASNAKQPMLNAAGDVGLIFNGEIFNSDEVRAQCRSVGYEFTRRSDTETLLAAFLCFGRDGFSTVEGIFAFALCDLRAGVPELWLMRDPVGVKPLYIAECGSGRMAFASEVGCLRALVPDTLTIDPASLMVLLSSGAVPQPATIYREIKAVPPGRLLHVVRPPCGDELIQTEVQVAPAYFQSDTTNGDALVQAVSAAALKQCRDQDEVHLFLGGGVDSALLGALTLAHGRSVEAHTLSFAGLDPGLDEAPTAIDLSASMAWRHHVHAVTPTELPQLFSAFATRIDQPTIDGFNGFLIAKALSKRTRVAFSGTGPDEMFFGYSWVADLLVLHRGERPSREALAHAWIDRTTIIPDGIASALCGMSAERIREVRLTSVSVADPGPEHALVDRLRMICLHRFTGDRLLRDLDVTGMAAGVEVRIPWLDAEVLRAGWRIGETALTASATGLYGGVKAPFISAAEPWLPRDFLAAGRKHGFILPYDRWLRGPLHGAFSEAFRTSSGELFDREALSERWRLFEAGAPLALEIWLVGTILSWRAASMG